jgi:MFS family permease
MRLILLLGIVSFINDTASKMILPVLPLYIQQIGGAGLAIGLVSGIGESVGSVLKVLSGYWSDRSGRRKPFVVWGYGISSLSKILLAWASTWPLVLALRTAERTGKGLRSAARDAMLASGATEHNRGRLFGIHRAFDSGGAVLGTLLVLLLVTVYDLSLSRIFLIAGLISFIALVPLLFAPETGVQRPAAKTTLTLSLRGFPRELRIFLVAGTLFALGNFSWMFFVLRAQAVAGSPDAFVFPILLYAVYQFVPALLSAPLGALADRIGKVTILLTGYLLFALVTLGFIVFQGFAMLMILFALYGTVFALIESNERAYIADLAAEHIRGTALGTFFTLTSLAALPAGIIAGLLYDASPTWMFAYGAALSVLAGALLLAAVIRGNRRPSATVSAVA